MFWEREWLGQAGRREGDRLPSALRRPGQAGWREHDPASRLQLSGTGQER